jgi:hypothetical protein
MKMTTERKKSVRWCGWLRYRVNKWRWFARLRCLVGRHPWGGWKPFEPLDTHRDGDGNLTVVYYQLRFCRRWNCHVVQVRVNPEPCRPSFQGDDPLRTKYRGNAETLFRDTRNYVAFPRANRRQPPVDGAGTFTA